MEIFSARGGGRSMGVVLWEGTRRALRAIYAEDGDGEECREAEPAESWLAECASRWGLPCTEEQ